MLDRLRVSTEKIRRKVFRRMPGYDTRNWLRIRQIDAFADFLAIHEDRSVLEISPGWNTYWKQRCNNYRAVDYPDFDICRHSLAEQFDIVIADQILEHVLRPIEATRNIHGMVKPGGYAMIATPFLFRVHARPHDYNRWTAAGLKQLLVEAGFDEPEIEVDQWGNRACARAHIGGTPVLDYGFWRDLSDDPEYPIQVWAFARRTAGEYQGGPSSI